MSEVIIAGNYLGKYGYPVLATQMPPVTGETPIGGYIVAVGWTCRWIKALAPDTEPAYSEGKVRWRHGGTSHAAKPWSWIVWDVDKFKVLPPSFFNSRYTPVNIPTELEEGGAE